jgi:glutamate transport system permease protein
MTAQLIPDRPARASRSRPRSNGYAAAFLYDEPGPLAKRRHLIGSVISCAVFAVVIGLGLWQFGAHGQLAPERWAPFTDPAVWQYLFVGLVGTLEAAVIVAVLGGLFGVLLAFARMSHRRWLSRLSGAYIEVARTIPVLLMIYLMLFGLPQIGINVPTLWKLVIPLTVANSAVFAEIVRAGVVSLPRGQREAALSLGMRSSQATRLVVLPQAVRAVAPSLVTQFVSLTKDTSLGYVVAFTELLYRGQVLATYLHLLIPTYLVVTLIYLVVNGSLTALAARLQRGQRRRPAKLDLPQLTAPIDPKADDA